MEARKTDETERLEEQLEKVPAGEIVVDTLAGAAAGAAMGAIAGPPGMVAGAVIGAAIGGAAAAGLHLGHAQEARADEALDRDIGVIGGNIGEAPPDAPKSQRGVFSATSMGVGGGGGSAPAEGTMQNIDAD
jgi:hypothetical protein